MRRPFAEANFAPRNHSKAVEALVVDVKDDGRLRLGIILVLLPVAAVGRVPKLDHGDARRPLVFDLVVEADAPAVEDADAEASTRIGVRPPLAGRVGHSARTDSDLGLVPVVGLIAGAQPDLKR